MMFKTTGPVYRSPAASHKFKPNLIFPSQNIIDFYGDNSDGFLDLAGPGGWNDPDMLVIG